MANESVRVSPKDVFLHLLAIITLYASAIALGTLLFQYIDYWFPAIGNAIYYREGLTNAMRFAISTLIVVFPVYFLTSRMLRKMYEAEPERKKMGIRKWLSYFTLFLAAAIAIGWLVAVINRFLEGDFTTAFLLKALAIFFITGSIFYYYRAITRGEENRKTVRNFGYVVAILVLVSVIAAFFIVGSPAKRRLEKQDAQRVSDLQLIQNQIVSYWQAKNVLPPNLNALNDSISGFVNPVDPETQKPYEYSVKGKLSFTLCADFASSGDQAGATPAVISRPAPLYGADNWQHPAGYFCFDRTIDPDRYKLYAPKL